MSHRYAIDYLPFQHRQGREFTREAATTAEAEECVMQLLSSGARVLAIRCDGSALASRKSDQLLKAAALRVAAGMLAISLGLNAAELHERFGLTSEGDSGK